MSTVDVAPYEGASVRAQDSERGELAWRPAHRREDVERYLAAVAEERQRLKGAIDAAEARTEQARQRSAAQLRDGTSISLFLLEAQRELALIEREHAEALEGIAADAGRRIAHVIAEARADAAVVRAAAASLADLLADDVD